MPSFDLREIYAAKYVNTAGVITYTGRVKVGDAMSANVEFKPAEGRCYAEGALSEYSKETVGGTISLGVKYIVNAAQKLMFGLEDSTQGTITGLKMTGNQHSDYVGVTLIAPDKVDGATKYTALFIAKALFGAPSMSFKTKEKETITFNTPTTTGEFMPDDSSDKLIVDYAVCDTIAAARTWCEAQLT